MCLLLLAGPSEDEELVKRVGKKINGKYALVTIFVALSRIRLVVSGTDPSGSLLLWAHEIVVHPVQVCARSPAVLLPCLCCLLTAWLLLWFVRPIFVLVFGPLGPPCCRPVLHPGWW